MAKGSPVLLAKDGILPVAEIGILYLTIYMGESWIAIRDMGIVDALNNSYILPQEAVDTTNRIVDRIHAAFQLPDDEQTQVYTHAAMEDHVFWKMQRQDAQTLTSILQGTRNSMNI